jgi:hypothetical protein
LVGSSEAKKVPGLVRFFSGIFCRVFDLPSPRNAQARDNKIEKKSVWDFFVDFFVKTFRHDLFAKRFL